MSTGPERSAIIISASSDLGTAMAQRWLGKGWKVSGTYRTRSAAVAELEKRGAMLIGCDLTDSSSVEKACHTLRQWRDGWHVLVVCPGTLDPVGPFVDTSFDQWEESITVNFTAQLRLVHALLPARRNDTPHGPCVLFFAGGGTNNATSNFSAYTVSRIALIKMCELLHAEIEDTRFAIVGPGWVKTKIHQSTLNAGARAGLNYERTLEKLRSGDFTSIDDVLDCCEWLIGLPRDTIGGRNFSVQGDRWGTDELASRLLLDPDLHKLRRRQ
jgi:NAD(P)-dependent dehydrogenase (short-subunit alcohol dehydrogenase family)